MADDGDAATTADRYAQALRFLVALQAQQQPSDLEAQRTFLRQKGLSEQEIDSAFTDARRPRDATTSDGLVATANGDNGDAFDRAAKMFDDPLHESNAVTTQQHDAAWQRRGTPSVPAKTYPRSPLALYGQQSSTSPTTSSIDNPLTRYHVLLRFFRSLCYVMVLAGGMTGVAVAIYRTYVMPKLIATLDARSDLLVHHRQLFATLAGRVKTMRGNSLAPPSKQVGAAAASGVGDDATARKGVLKKVQFADEVQHEEGGAILGGEDEDTKQAGDVKKVVDEEKVPLISEKESVAEAAADAATVADQAPSPSALEPIDILEPLRASLARLTATLKADLSAGAIGSSVRADATRTPAVRRRPAMATTVGEADEDSDADSWQDESDDDEDEESDELEFDPFAAPLDEAAGKGSRGPRKKARKHTPKSGGFTPSTLPLADRATAESTSAASLKSSLNAINAYINTQTYIAHANVTSSRTYAGVGGIGGGYQTGNAGGGGGESATPKAGDVGQVRAEIRSLKGLLLSRRNFPIYSRPAVAQPQQQRVEPAA